jgi:hypothetical protein
MVVSGGDGSEGVSGIDGCVGTDGGTEGTCGEEHAAPNIAAGISKTPKIISNPNNPLEFTRLLFISSSFSP